MTFLLNIFGIDTNKKVSAKKEAIPNKYNLEAIVTFMKKKFADLGKTYQESDLGQIRMLLSSIFPSGLAWSYPGYSNTEISPMFQAKPTIHYFSKTTCDPKLTHRGHKYHLSIKVKLNLPSRLSNFTSSSTYSQPQAYRMTT